MSDISNSNEGHIKKRIKVSSIAKIFENSDATQERICKRSNSSGKPRPPELSFDDVLKEVEKISFETKNVSSTATPIPTALSRSYDAILRDDHDDDVISCSNGRKSPYRMSLDNSLQSVPENMEVISRDPGYATPETLLQKLSALDKADMNTEKEQKEDSLEKSNSVKPIENISSRYQLIVRSQSMSHEEPQEKEIKNIQSKEKCIDMVNEGLHIGGMMDDLRSCEDFISFRNATVILLSQMNFKIGELNKRINSQPTGPAGGPPPPPPPPPPPAAPTNYASAEPPVSALNKRTSWRNMTETKLQPANFLLDEIRKKQESRNKRTSLKSKYEKLGTSLE